LFAFGWPEVLGVMPRRRRSASGHCFRCDRIRVASAANGQCRIVKYTVKNHDNTLAAGIPIAENITFSGYNCQQPAPTNTWQQRNRQASTDARGDFTDQRSMLMTRRLERRFGDSLRRDQAPEKSKSATTRRPRTTTPPTSRRRPGLATSPAPPCSNIPTMTNPTSTAPNGSSCLPFEQVRSGACHENTVLPPVRSQRLPKAARCVLKLKLTARFADK
jgi:hypothetical protein